MVIAVQNCDDSMRASLDKILTGLPLLDTHKIAVLPVCVPEGIDGRSRLLNAGISHATGRYLSFLDDDDTICMDCYAILISQLLNSKAAVAVGGSIMVRFQLEGNDWRPIQVERPFAWGRDRNDLLRDNFVPINSYAIDRSRVSSADLFFDESLTLLEDYEFLLRLCAKYEFNFERLDTTVCEYRVRQDNSNSIPYGPDAPFEAVEAHKRATALINERKKNILLSLPVSKWLEIQDKLVKYEEKIRVLLSLTARYEQEKIYEESRFLNVISKKIYAGFGRFPLIEKHLSAVVHSLRRDRKSHSSQQ